MAKGENTHICIYLYTHPLLCEGLSGSHQGQYLQHSFKNRQVKVFQLRKGK